ncbi:hypothetical protein JCM19240_5789 [Vibrio maritimus]|uniref:Uncharacterized protein n=1 Tax=Vibrio maritimus TaxID=990268 RepID=A0A090SZK1_9VIBR|nr:hypothetical protein JCM19240_5789 [Vibrio maritimus]
MFRVVLNLHCLPNYLTDFQDIVSELCWASYHSHNFDILDARNLLNSEGEPIVLRMPI